LELLQGPRRPRAVPVVGHVHEPAAGPALERTVVQGGRRPAGRVDAALEGRVGHAVTLAEPGDGGRAPCARGAAGPPGATGLTGIPGPPERTTTTGSTLSANGGALPVRERPPVAGGPPPLRVIRFLRKSLPTRPDEARTFARWLPGWPHHARSRTDHAPSPRRTYPSDCRNA